MTPGSPAAKILGCICSEISNQYGCGTGQVDMYGNAYIVSESCIIHGMSSWRMPKCEIPTYFEIRTTPDVITGKRKEDDVSD